MSKILVYGIHPCCSVLGSKKYFFKKVFVTKVVYSKHAHFIDPLNVNVEIVDSLFLDKLCGNSVVHQGIAMEVENFYATDYKMFVSSLRNKERSLVIVLDRICDPVNFGSIIRSAVAFDADGVLFSKRHAAGISSSVIKASSGAIFNISVVEVGSLHFVLKSFKAEGYWCYGFDSSEGEDLTELHPAKKSVMIVGSEESGLRSLVKKSVDCIVNIPISRKVDSLNVSNAACIGLYSYAAKWGIKSVE